MAKPQQVLQPGRFGPRDYHGRPRNGGPDWRKLFAGLLGASFLSVLGLAGTYAALFFTEWNSLNTLDIKPSEIVFTPAPSVTEEVTFEPPDKVTNRTTILLVGSDSRKGLSKEQLARIGTADDGSDLTDTIILAQLNPVTDQVAMLSLPRDLVVRRCDGTRGRINEAWFIGGLQGAEKGAACLVQTIERHTGIGIDHVMRVNFAGFVNVVDTLEGVDFAVDRDMRDRWSGLDIKKGCNHFDGVKAIQFVRARHIDSDFGRQARQQRFAREMINKATSLGTLTNPIKVASIINSASEAIETDTGLDAGRLVDIAWSMRHITADKLVAFSIPATNGRLGEAAVLFEDKAKAEEIYAQFRSGQLVEEPDPTSAPGMGTPAAGQPSAATGASSSAQPSTPASPLTSAAATPMATPTVETSTPGASPSPSPDKAKGEKERFAGSFDPGIPCP